MRKPEDGGRRPVGCPWPPSACTTRASCWADLVGIGPIAQEPEGLTADAFGSEFVLDQLGHHALPGDEVDHAERIDLHEPPAESIRQRREPVDDDHRLAVQRGLHCCGAGRGDDQIAGRQHGIGVARGRRSADAVGERPRSARRPGLARGRPGTGGPVPRPACAAAPRGAWAGCSPPRCGGCPAAGRSSCASCRQPVLGAATTRARTPRRSGRSAGARRTRRAPARSYKSCSNGKMTSTRSAKRLITCMRDGRHAHSCGAM